MIPNRSQLYRDGLRFSVAMTSLQNQQITEHGRTIRTRSALLLDERPAGQTTQPENAYGLVGREAADYEKPNTKENHDEFD